jgi:hypothetical protein
LSKPCEYGNLDFSEIGSFFPSLAGIFGKPTKFQKLDSFTNSIKRIIDQIAGKCNIKKNFFLAARQGAVPKGADSLKP